ncbi:MAG: hypothetical protein NZM26_00450 [Patescibacteria group bacterium]|nr:hypothetical protein [Patescibacteria group bacterium]
MQKPKPPKLVGLVVLTTITIVFWVFYGIYSTLKKVSPVNIPEEILNPLNPGIDLALLNTIASKEFYQKGETLPLTNSVNQNLLQNRSQKSEIKLNEQ